MYYYDGFFYIPALTVGDPHLTTLDGYAYTFNGIGEFVYLKTNDDSFQSQIRFEQFRDSNGINNIHKSAFAISQPYVYIYMYVVSFFQEILWAQVFVHLLYPSI